MGDDELAEIRRRRMEEMQRSQANPQAMNEEMERQKQAENQIQMILKQALEPEARERLNTIRMTRPEFAASIQQQLVTLAQSGRLQSRITDDQLKTLLKQVTPQKKEFTITRRR